MPLLTEEYSEATDDDTSALRRLPGESSWQHYYRLHGKSRAWQTVSDGEESGNGDEPAISLVPAGDGDDTEVGTDSDASVEGPAAAP